MSTSLDVHDVKDLLARVQALEAQSEIDQQLITALQAQSISDQTKIANSRLPWSRHGKSARRSA